MKAVGKVRRSLAEQLQRELERALRLEAQLGCREEARKGAQHIVLSEPEAGPEHPFELHHHGHRHEQRQALAHTSAYEPFRCGELRVVVLNDVSHQDVGTQRRHQRQGFISSMLTRLPLGALSMPAMSRMDLVLARTSVSSRP